MTCIGCKQRGAVCRSQEYDDDNAPEPGQKSDPPLTRRLDRLEQMMERIAERIVPDATGAPGPSSSQPQPGRRSASASSSRGLAPGRESPTAILQASIPGDGPIAALLAMRHESVHRRGPSESGPVSTPALTSVESATPTLPSTSTPQGATTRPPTSAGRELPSPKHFWVCTTLRSVIPVQSALDAILAASPSTSCVVALCYSDAEKRRGKAEPTSALAIIPPISSNPLLLARRALQILICMQQLPPDFDWAALNSGYTMKETMYRLHTTSLLATSNDDLIGYAEGVECLLLQGYYLANTGSLRKAWITFRRAMTVAQAMGMDRGHSAAFRSCDPKADPARRPSAHVLWYRLVFSDRYLSLFLGSPVGSHGDDFASEEACVEDTPIERLEKAHTMLSARIIEHNRNSQHRTSRVRGETAPTDYAVTQEIDFELEAAAKSMPVGWWEESGIAFTSYELFWESSPRITCQMHHFALLIFLHVPHMLRDPSSPRFDYSKMTCMESARKLLTSYITFRSLNISASICRRADYDALIAAMTLCLAYLQRRRGEVWTRLREDIELVEATKQRMEHVAGVSGDHLHREAVGTIEQFMSVITDAATGTGSGTSSPADAAEMQFNVPYLGSISVRLPRRRHEPAGLMGPASGSMDLFGSSPSSDVVMHFAPYNDQAPFGTGETAARPDLTADGEEWPLQGVDAAFWSLFERVM